jgi:hypothetical protein
MSLVFLLFNWHLLARRAHLVREDVTPAYRRTLLRRNTLGVVPYALATVGALLTPFVTLVICAAVAVYFLLPFTAPDSNQSAVAATPSKP